MFTDCIILAGGAGTRLWPLSTSRLPKQFLPLPGGGGGRTFFQAAAERAFAVLEKDGRLLVIASKSMTGLVLRDCAALPAAERSRITLIPEPQAKNTAAAIACAAAYITRVSAARGDAARAGAARGADAEGRTILVLTSDHLIESTAQFAACALTLREKIQNGGFGVFGIPPSRAETGYGYIETEHETGTVKRVLSFHEKPDALTAERYLAAGNYFWNSGMFAFNAGYLLRLFRACAPDVWTPFEGLEAPPADAYTFTNAISVLDGWRALAGAYAQSAAVSFDYAIAEKAPLQKDGAAFMTAASFLWADIGSWDEYAKADSQAAAKMPAAATAAAGAAVFTAGGSGNYVHSEIPVALCGVDDLIVVIKNGADGSPPAALITKKGAGQAVRGIPELLKAAGRTDLC